MSFINICKTSRSVTPNKSIFFSLIHVFKIYFLRIIENVSYLVYQVVLYAQKKITLNSLKA